MLKINIPRKELYDDKNEEFITIPETVLQLEHSLLSLSKWESKWCKPFLPKDKNQPSMTDSEVIDYIRCMTINSNVNDLIYTHCLTPDNINEITTYINSPMTATWFNNNSNTPHSREIVTAELIYYWMIAYNIPFECQKWHLNKLLTLIRVCGIKNTPPKKRSKYDLLNERRNLNAERLKSMGTHG